MQVIEVSTESANKGGGCAVKMDDIEAAINLPDYALKLLAQKDAEIASLTAANTYHELQLDRAREEIGRLRGELTKIKSWPAQECLDEDIPDIKEDAYTKGYEDALIDIARLVDEALAGDSK